MNIESIKNNVDRKIERFLKDDKLSFSEIITKLNTTSENFKKLLSADTNSSARKHMITAYNAFSEKRMNDIQWAVEHLGDNNFFAGISDEDLFKLIKLRDKISQDVLEAELF